MAVSVFIYVLWTNQSGHNETIIFNTRAMAFGLVAVFSQRLHISTKATTINCIYNPVTIACLQLSRSKSFPTKLTTFPEYHVFLNIVPFYQNRMFSCPCTLLKLEKYLSLLSGRTPWQWALLESRRKAMNRIYAQGRINPTQTILRVCIVVDLGRA